MTLGGGRGINFLISVETELFYSVFPGLAVCAGPGFSASKPYTNPMPEQITQRHRAKQTTNPNAPQTLYPWANPSGITKQGEV
jgi:hypothetical protein